MHDQERGDITCKLLDVENNRCSVYSARPGACRLFGRVSELVCPHGSETHFPPVLVDLINKTDHDSPVVMLSHKFNWMQEFN